MPNYISVEGEFHPAKEKVALMNHKTGEPYIYEGPDRAALFELWKAGETKFGQNFRHDADFLLRVRNLGYKDIDDFLQTAGYDAEKSKKDAEKKAEKVTKHELPKKVAAIRKLGGGVDTAGGGQDKYGDFGTPKDLP